MQKRRLHRNGIQIFLVSMIFLIALSACGAEPQTEKSEGRLIQHAMGETRVPEKPERVVVLDTNELDTAISLGITPVGAVTSQENGGFMSYLQDKTAGIENVGTIAQPNLEAILQLEPDLILSNKGRHEKIYQQLSDIAPTVFAERTGVVWKENLELYAQALNRTAEAEQLKEAYAQRIQEFQDAMGDRIATTSVSILRTLPEATRLYQKGSFIGTILEDIGFARPESQQQTEETFVEVGYERIIDMDGDVIFVTYYGDRESLDLLQEQAQWKELQAVKDGQVFEVKDDVWMSGIGMSGAQAILDQLFEYLV